LPQNCKVDCYWIFYSGVW